VLLVPQMWYSPAAVLSTTDSSSIVNIQKSTTTKPLVGWSCMTKRWNAGRVGYVFCFQLRDIIPPYQSQISFFILLFAFTPVLSLFLPGWLQWDSDAFLFCCSQMNMDDYPHGPTPPRLPLGVVVCTRATWL
jgi:hypothetical protein